MRRLVTAILILATVGLLLPNRPVPAAFAEAVPIHLGAPQDFDIPGGHFFKQANRLGGAGDTGYAVIDDAEAKFWSEFRRLGGLDAVGYPISRRFKWNGFVVQGFQRGVLQWRPDVGQAWFVNVFDLMHDSGLDEWLVKNKSTPKPLETNFDAGKSWEQIVKDRQALLDANPAIKARYYASPDPMTFFGLPTSKVTDNGNHFVIRLQRAVIQQWKVDVPWAKAGQVTVANGGDLGAEAGFYPATGFDIESPTGTRNGKTVALDPGHGGPEIGAARTENPRVVEKELTLAVALRTGAYLAANGYRVVITRNADTRVNVPPRDLTGDKAVSLKDDLQARIDIANNAKADVLVSMHFNGFSDPNLKGTAVHFSLGRPISPQCAKLSQSLQTHLVQAIRAAGYTGLADRGVQDDSRLFGPTGHLYLLGGESARPSSMPGVLTESMFISSPEDADQLAQPEIVHAVALGHARGIAAYFGLPFSANPAAAPLPAGNQPPAATPPPATTTAPPKPGSATPSATTTPAPTQPAGRQGKVQSGGQGATLRAEPNTGAAAVKALPDNATVGILGVVKGTAVDEGESRWYKVTYEGQTGYVYAPIIVATDPKLVLPSSKATVANPETGEPVNARAGPRTDQALVQRVPDGTVVEVLDVVAGQAVEGTENRWYQVVLGDVTAFIYGGLLKLE